VNGGVRQESSLTQESSYNRLAVITRSSFADFLDRYADKKTGTIEWDHFVVQHYGDSFLEEVRRCVARLATNKLQIHGDTEAASDLIRSWATLLRSSTNCNVDRKPDVATIDMTPSEAVLLDSILRRYSESNILTVENAAEQQCLWNIQCLIEKHGDQPVWPSLHDATSELTPEQS
jgi:predicted CopG family antitoxin